VRCVFWDFDCTLAHRPGKWSGAVVDVLRAQGWESCPEVEAVRPYLRSGFPWHRPEEVRSPASATSWWGDLEPSFRRAYRELLGVDVQTAARWASMVRETYLDLSGWQVFEDTTSTLAQARSLGWSSWILSNHVPELEQLVEGLGLRSLVEGVISSGITGVEKPNVRAFQHALQSVPPGSMVWMVGDDPVCDVAGAEAAGIPAILVRNADATHHRSCTGLSGVLDYLSDGLRIEARPQPAQGAP